MKTLKLTSMYRIYSSFLFVGVPLAWALTSNRKQQIYDKIWSKIVEWSMIKQSPIKVKRFIVDFETAQRNSIEKNVSIFHIIS